MAIELMSRTWNPQDKGTDLRARVSGPSGFHPGQWLESMCSHLGHHLRAQVKEDKVMLEIRRPRPQPSVSAPHSAPRTAPGTIYPKWENTGCQLLSLTLQQERALVCWPGTLRTDKKKMKQTNQEVFAISCPVGSPSPPALLGAPRRRA